MIPDPEKIAQDTIERICREGFLDCKGTPPCHTQRDITDIMLLVKGAVFSAMKGMQEACAARIEESLRFMPDGLPSFIAQQAEGTIRQYADNIRSIPIPGTMAPYVTQADLQPDEGAIEAVKVFKEKIDRRHEPVTTSFECQWCQEAGLPKEKFTHQGIPGGSDFYGRPLCKECVDRCEPPPKET